MVAWTRHGLKPLATEPETFLHLNTSIQLQSSERRTNRRTQKGPVDVHGIDGAGDPLHHLCERS